MVSEIKRVSSGIKELDELLGGGFPTGHAILLEKDSGSGGGLFSIYFLWNALKEGKYACYFVTDKDPKLIEYRAKSIGTPLGEYMVGNPPKFVFIDGFHGGHLRAETKKEYPYTIEDLRDVPHIHDVFREVMMGWGHESAEIPADKEIWDTRAVWSYDSISTLIYYGGTEALSLVAHQMAAQKKHEYTGLFVVENDSLPERVMRLLELWADGIITLTTEKMTRFSEGVVDREILNPPPTDTETKNFLEIKKLRWFDNYYRGKVEYSYKEGKINIEI